MSGPPPSEAARLIKSKAARTSFSWKDVSPEDHAVSFTAAKAATLDVAQALQEALAKAEREGTPFEASARSWSRA